MSRAFLNKIDVSNVDYTEIDRRYDFYLIENQGEGFKPNARIFDDSLAKENVQAVQYTSGKSFILMMKKNRQNDSVVAEIIKNARSEELDLTKKKLPVPFEKYQHSLIQILFNALAKTSSNNVSNLGGKLYYFSEKSKKQIFCVEVRLSDGFVLHLDGRTFTESTKSNGENEYVLQLNNTLRLRSKTDAGKPFYTLFQYKGTRHQIPFLDASSVSKFESSKIGILSKLLEKFHKEYGSFAQIQIKEEPDWEKLDVKAASSQKKEHLRRLKQILCGKKINIVDKIKKEGSFDFCEKLKKSIEQIFTNEEYFLKNNRELNFSIVFSDDEMADCLNLRIIHSKDYCRTTSEEDLYRRFLDRPVQHVTFEDFPRCTKDDRKGVKKKGDLEESACVVILNELVVKYDLIANAEKSISLIDWSSYKYENVWKFCFCKEKMVDLEKKTKENHYYLMMIKPSGNFEIKEVTIESEDEYGLCDEIFALNNKKAERHNKWDEKYIGLVINSSEDIDIIQETPCFMLPSVDDVFCALKKEEVNRKKDTLERLFAGCLDIYYKMSVDNSCEYYSVGQIGSGIQQPKVERSAQIRKIVPHKQSKLFFRDVLETMNVPFVRNGQLTVMPFPFKYLREWIKMHIE